VVQVRAFLLARDQARRQQQACDFALQLIAARGDAQEIKSVMKELLA